MKTVIIIAITFVLLIPTTVFAQYAGNVGDGEDGSPTLEEALELQKYGIAFSTDKKLYYQFGVITLSGVVDIDSNKSEIFIEIFSPEEKITGFPRDINPDGTFIVPYHTNPDVFTLDGEYTFKLTYVNSIEKTINYQKF